MRVAQLVRQQQIEARQRDRIEQELKVARLIQQTLLPHDVPHLAGWDVAAYYQSLARANDPIYEFGFRFMGGGAQQEQIWRHVLTQLAQHWDVEPAVEVRKLCVDSRLQWSKAKNVWHNAVIRTTVTAPARWTRKALGRNP